EPPLPPLPCTPPIVSRVMQGPVETWSPARLRRNRLCHGRGRAYTARLVSGPWERSPCLCRHQVPLVTRKPSITTNLVPWLQYYTDDKVPSIRGSLESG